MQDNKLKIHFEYCYGIKKIDYEFDFSHQKYFSIYSPNGLMKTSFAQTFKDFSEKKNSLDRVFTAKQTVRNITDGTNSSIDNEEIFVIEPYNQDYKSDKISTLIANKILKEKYDKIYNDIDEKKQILIKYLQKTSGVKDKIDEEISFVFTKEKGEFFKALTRIAKEIEEGEKSYLSDIKYMEIFNEKVIALLKDENFKRNIEEYMECYDKLIIESNFFKKGVFNHNNASDIAKNLKNNGFFLAEHSVYLNRGGVKKEVSTVEELEDVINQEKNNILEDSKLLKLFNNIDDTLKKNKELKAFREYLEENKKIIPELNNLELLKEKLWIAYLTQNKDYYNSLMQIYISGKDQINSIIEEAKQEITKWENVIKIFNDRFSVPFIVAVVNQTDVILNQIAPTLQFKFKDSENGNLKDIEEQELKKVLSNGEKRALYILNIIFEVEARKNLHKKTIFIFDDIADSFDYKNKYAIIEYLYDISNEDDFYQIILSHNFDFYRTISGRLDIRRENRLHAIRYSDYTVHLEEEIYQNNLFKYWKEHLDSNMEMLIASVPFLRNLAEYGGLNVEYDRLTALLHQKTDTSIMTINDLEIIIKKILCDKQNIILRNHSDKVETIIYILADSICSASSEQMELEKKIILSIAIRLKAEKFLIDKINDPIFVNQITKNQTISLINKYCFLFPNEKEKIKLVKKVNLMTPENIHLNSFMYEPILDMSNHHLKTLYNDISMI